MTATVIMEWALYSPSNITSDIAVIIDLTGQVVTPLEAVRSIKIDNTFCAVPIYVQFTDTLDTIVCPAYAVVTSPVYTNSQKCIVYGDQFFDGRPPQTTIEFNNFPQSPSTFQTGLSDPVEIVFQSKQVSTTVLSTYTFNAMAFPTPQGPTRILAAVFSSRSNAGGGFQFVSGSIAGQAVLQAANGAAIPVYAPGGLVARVDIVYALVPSGTNGTVTITYNNAGSSCVCELFSITNWTELFPYNTIAELESAANTPGGLVSTVRRPTPGSTALFAQYEATSVQDAAQFIGATNISGQPALPVGGTGSQEQNCAIRSFDTTDGVGVYAIGNILTGAIWR